MVMHPNTWLSRNLCESSPNRLESCQQHLRKTAYKQCMLPWSCFFAACQEGEEIFQFGEAPPLTWGGVLGRGLPDRLAFMCDCPQTQKAGFVG